LKCMFKKEISAPEMRYQKLSSTWLHALQRHWQW
jgi:hypothetical protein